MLVKIRSIANIGLDCVPVDVEVDVASIGFPGFTIVGLASKAVAEARERVKTAIINSKLDFPPRKITVNLAPADLPKDGAAYDLPIAVGVLLASGQLNLPPGFDLTNSFFYGELSLDGTLRPTKGILLLGLFAQKLGGLSTIFVPKPSAAEASVVESIKVMALNSLSQLVGYFLSREKILPLKMRVLTDTLEEANAEFDLSEIAG
jgi:magnesium chelatase family protein